MSLSSFLGIGFSFGGKDENLTKTLDNVAKRFSTVQTAFSSLANGAKSLGGQVSTGLKRMGSAGGRALSGIAGALDGMAQRALDPKIDNAFSSMHAQFAKSFGETTVGMKMSSKEAGRWRRTIGSAAFALNADMGQTAKGWVEFRKQGVKLDQLLGTKGMTSTIKTLVKITSVFGVEGEQIALMASGLIKGFGYTEKQVRLLMGTVYRMGEAFNVGKDMMQEMPGVLQTINKELADFGSAADRKNVDQYTKSIVKLAIGFKESLGMSAKDAISTSKSLFSTLMGERKNLVNMFRGMGGEFSEISQALAEPGGVRKSLQMILQDPAKFMDALRQMAKKTQKEGGKMGVGFQRLVGVMNKTLGPDVTYAMKGNWDKASGAMAKLDKIASQTSKNLTALAKAANKAFRSGRTEGESFQIMLQSQEAQLHRLSAPLMTQWIKDHRKGFKTFLKTVKEAASKKGPLGELTKRLLLVQRVGITGLFSGGMGAMVSKTVKELGPLLTAFAAFGMSLAMIGKLLLPGGILLIGLALFHKGARDKIVGTLTKVWDYLKENVPKWVPKVKAALSLLWKKAVEGVNWAMDIVAPMIEKISVAIGNIDWGGLAQKVISFVGKFFRGVFNAVMDIGTTDFDMSTAEGRFMSAGATMIGSLAKGALAALKVAGQNIWAFFSDWSMGFEQGLREKGRLLGGAFIVAMFFGSTRKLMMQGALQLVKLVAVYLIWPMLAIMGQFFMGMIARQGTYLAVSMTLEKASYAKKLGMAITYHVKSIAWTTIAWAQSLAISAAGWINRLIIEKAGWAASKITMVAGWAFAIATTVAGWIATNAAMIAGAIVAAAAWAIAFWPVTAVIAAIALVGLAFYALSGKLGETAQIIAKVITWPFVFLWETIEPLVGAIKSLFSGDLGGFFKNFANFLGKVITAPFRFVWGLAERVVGVISFLWNKLRGSLGETGQAIMDNIAAPFKWAWNLISGIIDSIKNAWAAATNFIGSIGSSIGNGISSMLGIVQKKSEVASGGIAEAIEKAAKAAELAMVDSQNSIQKKTAQTTSVVAANARNQTTVAKTEAANLRTGVDVQFKQMQESIGIIYTAIVKTGATAANILLGHSAQSVNGTRDYWSIVPPFLSKVFNSVLGASARSNTEVMQHGAKAAVSTTSSWGKSGQFVGNVWNSIGKSIVGLWEGITTGAIKSSDVVIKTALANAKAFGITGQKLTDLGKAYEEVVKMGKEHRKFSESERLNRKNAYFDMIKQAGKMKGEYVTTGPYAGMKVRDALRLMSGGRESADETKKTAQSMDAIISSYRNLAAQAEEYRKVSDRKWLGIIQNKMQQVLKSGQKFGLTTDDIKRGVGIGGARAAERFQSKRYLAKAKALIAEESAIRAAVAEFQTEGGKAFKGLKLSGSRLMGTEKLTTEQLQRFRARARELAARRLNAGAGADFSAPEISAGAGLSGSGAGLLGRLKVKKIGAGKGAVKTMPASLTGAAENKVNWTVSDETQKVMGKISDTVENLAAAINNLGKPQVTINFTGDIAPFMKRLRRETATGYGGLVSRQA